MQKSDEEHRKPLSLSYVYRSKILKDKTAQSSPFTVSYDTETGEIVISHKNGESIRADSTQAKATYRMATESREDFITIDPR